MRELSAQWIAQAAGGLLQADKDIKVTSLSTDTRTLKPGALFVAIRGERFDGHHFAVDAVNKGAVLILAQKDGGLDRNIPAIYVDDTVEALGSLAAAYRSLFNIPVVAVTGSVGKTSTKEMIAAVLSRDFNVHKTKGNLNNEIGLPLSVMALEDSHEAAVFEMGMSGFGEISRLSRIVRPDVAVITNIGISHIGRLGSRQNILKAKLEILEGMTPGGTVVLNGDDELLSGLKGLLEQKTLLYGIGEEADLQAGDLLSKGEEGVSFSLHTHEGDVPLFVPAPGMHNVHNALAAVAVARILKMKEDRIREGLAAYTGERLRMCIEDYDGIKVINDCYNAAPNSTQAALEVLKDIGRDHRKWAVLGDMLELGDWSEQAHLEIGKLTALIEADYLVAVGCYASWYIRGAELEKTDGLEKVLFEKASDAADYIRSHAREGDVMLFKGSRRMQLDVLIKTLFDTETGLEASGRNVGHE